jgi:polar amino acid transport system substrate-binding protein
VGKDPALANVKVLDDLAGKRVCVAAGSTNEQELAKHKQVVAVVVPDLTDCMVKFQRGEVDGVTGDDTVLAGFAKQDPYAVVLPTRITSEPYGLGINKDNIDLVRFVNGVLESVRTSDRWAGYYRKWVGTPAPNPPAARYGRPDAVR